MRAVKYLSIVVGLGSAIVNGAVAATVNGQPSTEPSSGWLTVLQPAGESFQGQVRMIVEPLESGAPGQHLKLSYAVLVCGNRPFRGVLPLGGDARLWAARARGFVRRGYPHYRTADPQVARSQRVLRCAGPRPDGSPGRLEPSEMCRPRRSRELLGFCRSSSGPRRPSSGAGPTELETCVLDRSSVKSSLAASWSHPRTSDQLPGYVQGNLWPVRVLASATNSVQSDRRRRLDRSSNPRPC